MKVNYILYDFFAHGYTIDVLPEYHVLNHFEHDWLIDMLSWLGNAHLKELSGI